MNLRGQTLEHVCYDEWTYTSEFRILETFNKIEELLEGKQCH